VCQWRIRPLACFSCPRPFSFHPIGHPRHPSENPLLQTTAKASEFARLNLPLLRSSRIFLLDDRAFSSHPFVPSGRGPSPTGPSEAVAQNTVHRGDHPIRLSAQTRSLAMTPDGSVASECVRVACYVRVRPLSSQVIRASDGVASNRFPPVSERSLPGRSSRWSACESACKSSATPRRCEPRASPLAPTPNATRDNPGE